MCYLFQLLFHFLFIALIPVTGQDTTIVWEFIDGLEGWGQAASNEMQAEVSHMAGGDELWMDFLDGPYDGSSDPYIDSPTMNLSIGERQTLALRYRYMGRSQFGKLSLQGRAKDEDEGEDTNVVSIDDDEDAVHLYFSIENDGRWHIGYIPLEMMPESGNYMNKNDKSLSIQTIQKMRLWPGCKRDSLEKWEQSEASGSGDAFQIDWIRLVRAPIINRISGCTGEKIAYGSTYNCLREGGEEIVIEGYNFGKGGVDHLGAPAHVFIDGKPCTFVTHDRKNPQERLTCITPPLQSKLFESLGYRNGYRPSTIEVKNGKLPGLVGASSQLTYASYPSIPKNVSLSNFASRSIDLSWIPGGEPWQQMTYTGYILRWRTMASPSWTHSAVVGNITTTTVRGLSSNTTYVFGVAGLNENQNHDPSNLPSPSSSPSPMPWWNEFDQYGRRTILENALEGGIAEIQGRTIIHDVNFERFDANSTQYHNAHHEGLTLVEGATIANCNASSFCCDQYNDELGQCMGEDTMTCLSPGPSFYPFEDTTSSNGREGRVIIANLSTYSQTDRALFNSQCGPSLRLTPSEARVRGAAYYPQQLEVSEGFETTFTAEISNPSYRCNNMDGIYTNCRSRGADGFAFVIQAEEINAIGSPGMGLGYDGINNSIAIEFDTYFNFEAIDPYENHISIHTGGWRVPNTSNHSHSLGHTNQIRDLTDGPLHIRVTYKPISKTNEEIFSRPGFVTSPHVMSFFENDWAKGPSTFNGSSGIGVLTVYCCDDNLSIPVLAVPLSLRKTLDLSSNEGRAWVGFTAATGVETYQVHDVLSWQFSSLRLDDL